MNPLFFIDLETTGLDADRCSIIEIGMIVTNEKLVELDHFHAFVDYHQHPPLWDQIAYEMHRDSGLIDAVDVWGRAPDVSEGAATEWVAMMSAQYGATEKSPMCGSSVHFDRAFLKAQMPTLESLFSYRNIDVSTVKELAKFMEPVIYENRPQGESAHRSLDDIRASIAELCYYQEHWFRS